MNKSLTHQERQYVKKIMHDAEKRKTKAGMKVVKWVPWALLLLGGFLMVYTLVLVAQGILNNTATITTIFFPGVGGGLLLMFAGVFIIFMFEKDRKSVV